MNIDEEIVGHMNQCMELVRKDIAYMESIQDLDNYSAHYTVLDMNLLHMAIMLLGSAEQVELQIAERMTGAKNYHTRASRVRKLHEELKHLLNNG